MFLKIVQDNTVIDAIANGRVSKDSNGNWFVTM